MICILHPEAVQHTATYTARITHFIRKFLQRLDRLQVTLVGTHIFIAVAILQFYFQQNVYHKLRSIIGWIPISMDMTYIGRMTIVEKCSTS